jgi:hypothetical protein
MESAVSTGILQGTYQTGADGTHLTVYLAWMQSDVWSYLNKVELKSKKKTGW